MKNGVRYLVFAMMDLLLAGFVFYRSLLPVVQGDAPFGGSAKFAVVLVIFLLVAALRFVWLAKKRWEY